MEIPLQITFRGIDPSASVEARIRDKTAKLGQYCERLMRTEVVVEARHQRHHKGRLYHVRVDLTLPGGEVVADREAHRHHAHEDVYVALRDAFDEAIRQLEDRVRRRRGDTKIHAVPAHGRVLSLKPAQGYGFIDTGDGNEIYFHRHAVTGEGFAGLAVGDEVRYVVVEGEGEQGPQASTVSAIGKHHLPPTETV